MSRLIAVLRRGLWALDVTLPFSIAAPRPRIGIIPVTVLVESRQAEDSSGLGVARAAGFLSVVVDSLVTIEPMNGLP